MQSLIVTDWIEPIVGIAVNEGLSIVIIVFLLVLLYKVISNAEELKVHYKSKPKKDKHRNIREEENEYGGDGESK